MPPRLRRTVRVLLGAVVIGLVGAPAAQAIQASGSIVLEPSKQSGLLEGEEISVDISIRNTSTATATLALLPNPATLGGTISVRLGSSDCCGADGSAELEFIPGPAAGCEAKGGSVSGCTDGLPGEVLIDLAPNGVLLPASDAPVFLATLRLRNTVRLPSVLPQLQIRASTGVCALESCVSLLQREGCVDGAAEGGTFVVGTGGGVGSCEAPVCADGVVDPGETCDDGNLVDGDGCDSNCTMTGCGNGVVTAGEACDDGDLDSRDECDACGIGVCPSGTTFTGARLRLTGLNGARGAQTLTFTGRIECGVACGFIDPLRDGLQLRIDVPPGGPLFDLTRRTRPVPPAEGLACDPDRDGWRVSSEGNAYTYRNASGALVSAGCAPGSALGLRTVRITKRPDLSQIALRVVVDRATLPTPSGTPRLGIVFDSGQGIGTPECAATAFVGGDCGPGQGGGYTCN
jgi:cysteine-rich repeat protein